jgi:hypothetical protein
MVPRILEESQNHLSGMATSPVKGQTVFNVKNHRERRLDPDRGIKK